MVIDKIIAVEGLDKTGKSTFCDTFERLFSSMYGIENRTLVKYAFPNDNDPIGKEIKYQLTLATPDPDIVSTPNFLSEMSHFWKNQLFKNYQTTIPNESLIQPEITNNVTYLFDRYFISTLAYQAFINNSKVDLEFIKYAINHDSFIKIPSDIIFLDLPNEKIIERTLADEEAGLNDTNDTLDPTVLDMRRDAYLKSLEFLKPLGINVISIEDVSLYSVDDLVKVLMGKLYN